MFTHCILVDRCVEFKSSYVEEVINNLGICKPKEKRTVKDLISPTDERASAIQIDAEHLDLVVNTDPGADGEKKDVGDDRIYISCELSIGLRQLLAFNASYDYPSRENVEDAIRTALKCK